MARTKDVGVVGGIIPRTKAYLYRRNASGTGPAGIDDSQTGMSNRTGSKQTAIENATQCCVGSIHRLAAESRTTSRLTQHGASLLHGVRRSRACIYP
jgi:hypothetical protein